MAMNKTVMGGLIFNYVKTELEANFQGKFELDLMQKMCEAIAAGVVEHIQQAAQVTGSNSGGAIQNGKVL